MHFADTRAHALHLRSVAPTYTPGRDMSRDAGIQQLLDVPKDAPQGFETEICSSSEAVVYLRLIDCVYHSTLGLRVTKKKKKV